MAAYAEGMNILRHANVGNQQHAIDARRRRCRTLTLSIRSQSTRHAEVWRRGSSSRHGCWISLRPRWRKTPRRRFAAGSPTPGRDLDDQAAIDEAVPAPCCRPRCTSVSASRGEAGFGDKLVVGDAL